MAKYNKSSNGKKKKQQPSFIQAIGLKDIFGNDIINFFAGLLLLCVSVLMILSFVSYFVTGPGDQSLVLDLRPGEWLNTDKQFTNAIGSIGALTSHFLISRCFGLAAFFVPILCALLGLRLMKVYDVNVVKMFFIVAFLMIWVSVFFSAFFTNYWGDVFEDAVCLPGGDHGEAIRQAIENIIGFPGLISVLVVTALAFLTYVSSETIRYVRMIVNPSLYKLPKVKFKITNNSEQSKDNAEVTSHIVDDDLDDQNYLPDPETFDNPETQKVTFTVNGEPLTPPDFVVDHSLSTNNDDANHIPDLTVNQAEEIKPADGNKVPDLNTPINHKEPFVKYKYPVLDLLKTYDDDGKPYINMEEQKANSDRIHQALNDFGVEVSSISATVGPTITLYEITLGPGVRISKIRNLSDDLALSLHALGVRIIAPMPGKGTVGIEVPNKKKNIVSMESILNSEDFQKTKMALPLALGKTITNQVFMVDLAKLPHLLVAGATVH